MPPSADGDRAAAPSRVRYEGLTEAELAERVGVPRAVAFDLVTSTLDVAHTMAADGAEAGTLVVADAQSAGRGRQGRVWRSAPGAGVWLTMIERPTDTAALDVLSLRIGIEIAPALDALAEQRIRLKWPNDLFVGDRKVGGILVEARWRERAPEWVAIGVGINLRAPGGDLAATGLRQGVSRLDVLAAVVPAIRRASATVGGLTRDELARFAARDLAAGRACTQPVEGRVAGIDASGALLVDVGSTRRVVRAGSLVLREEA